MTGISIDTFITTHRLHLPRLRFPRLVIGAELSAVPGLISDAFKMAYLAPYSDLHRRPQLIPDDDLKGRDPNW